MTSQHQNQNQPHPVINQPSLTANQSSAQQLPPLLSQYDVADSMTNRLPEKIAVLGATGSIGTSTLDIIAHYPDRYQLYAISGYRQLDELLALCHKFKPARVAVAEEKVDEFASRLRLAGFSIEVVGGQAGLIDIAKDSEVDTVVAAIVGSAGLASTLAGVQAGKRILLANKEALVMAGNLLMDTARQSGAVILPIDSEHNAIFQCLPQVVQRDSRQIHHPDHGIRQLWLTASGGPFLHKSFAEMQSATVEQAVNHPNWSMGQKISIDSATMMNKGLELIEACYLFDLPENKIKVAIHPQSIIHSMAEYVDGSILAQMGTPDMRTPIANCLSYPNRIDNSYEGGVQSLDLFAISQLTFIEPDLEKFANLKLAREAMSETQQGQSNWANISLNASNEVAVGWFLQGTSKSRKIRLTDIAEINRQTLDKLSDYVSNHVVSDHTREHVSDQSMATQLTTNTLEEIMQVDDLARKIAQSVIDKLQH